MRVFPALLSVLWLMSGVVPAIAKTNYTWVNTEYDFGLIKESDGLQTGTFQLINKGGKPIKITEVRPSCGCTSVDFPLEKINKGDTAVITVSFDPEDRPGKFDKGIYVTLDKEDLPVNLRIKGTVLASQETLSLFFPAGTGELRADNATLDFGEIPRGVRRREFIDIYNSATESLTPEISSASNAISFSLQPTHIQPGEQATITVYIDTSKIPFTGLRQFPVLIKWGDRQVLEISAKALILPE